MKHFLGGANCAVWSSITYKQVHDLCSSNAIAASWDFIKSKSLLQEMKVSGKKGKKEKHL